VLPLPGCPTPRVEVLDMDLASLASVRAACRAFNRRSLPLHVLVCNAGLMSPPQRLQTQDGLEMQFQVRGEGLRWPGAAQAAARAACL
jgi:WW domain-containing oxidoreductase